MTTNRGTAGGPARRTFEPRGWARPPGFFLLGLALYGLMQSGCASNGCSTCGLGSRFRQGVQAVGAGIQSGVQSVGTVFRHKRSCGGGADCGCGGGVGGIEEGVVIDSGVPIVPGAMAIPGQGTIVPAPAIESAPTQLEPIPSNQPANPTSGTGANSAKSSTSRSSPNGNNRSGYTTMRPKGRGSDVAQTVLSTPVAKGRSAQADDAVDLFANIPPVDLPSEVTRKAVGPTSVPAPTSPPANATATQENATPPAAEKVSAAEGATLSLPPIEGVAAHQAPGLHRFASVAPLIGGGSAPSIEGLDWLKEKGYRTFLDLRKGSEIEPNFVDAVNDRGMVYISLPIVANRLDPSRLARFDDLLSRSENRPLFFCDKDGTLAGLAWYIHLRVVGQDDPRSATSKAEEIGLTVVEAKIAEDFVEAHKPKARAALARVALATPPPVVEPKPAPAPPASALPTSTSPPAQPASPAVAPAPSTEPTPSMLPGEDRPQASNEPAPDYRDPNAWRPVAALVLTSLGVPLAYWSRSMFSEFRHVRRVARASLPGSTPRSLESPAGSDA